MTQPTRSTAARALHFVRLAARWGFPARSLLFGPLSLGDDLLCTAVLREARRRGRPFTMMTARPELFSGNPDPLRVLPIDNDYVAGLRRLGALIVQPYYVRAHPTNPQSDVPPERHIIAEMCALASLTGECVLRPYLYLTEAEKKRGQLFPRQIAIQSTGLNAALPYATKEWGAERFAEVARRLAPRVRLVQLGSAGDPPLPVETDLRGRTTLREAAGILAGSAAFIGLEGFLAHLARAVDCPSIVIAGGRARAGIFTYSANRNFLTTPDCSPCGLRDGCPNQLKCMTVIEPAAVADVALDLLAHPPGRPLVCDTATLP